MPRTLAHILGILTLLAGLGCAGKGKWQDAGWGQWEYVGPAGVSVESARLEKVKIRGGLFGGAGQSSENVFVVHTLFRNRDDKVRLKYIPWQSDRMPVTTDLALTDEKKQHFKGVVAFGAFASVVGRPPDAVILSAGDPPVSDLVTFEAKAASASTLYLELPAKWMQQGSKGWEIKPAGTFRFRIPRSLWQP